MVTSNGYLLEPLNGTTVVTSYYELVRVSATSGRSPTSFPMISEATLVDARLLERNVIRCDDVAEG